MAFVHVPAGMFETLKTVLSAFLHSLDNIKLKWEPHDNVAQLRECEFDSLGPFFLLIKGVGRSLQSELREPGRKARWRTCSSGRRCRNPASGGGGERRDSAESLRLEAPC